MGWARPTDRTAVLVVEKQEGKMESGSWEVEEIANRALEQVVHSYVVGRSEEPRRGREGITDLKQSPCLGRINEDERGRRR